MVGIFWSIVAGVGFGFFQLLNRRTGRDLDAFQGTFILLAISAVILAIASVVTEDVSLLWAASPMAYLNFALAGLVHFFLGWTFLTISQQRVGAARTGALIGSAPLFATFIAALTLGEYLDLPTILGIVLVVAGVYFVSNG